MQFKKLSLRRLFRRCYDLWNDEIGLLAQNINELSEEVETGQSGLKQNDSAQTVC